MLLKSNISRYKQIQLYISIIYTIDVLSQNHYSLNTDLEQENAICLSFPSLCKNNLLSSIFEVILFMTLLNYMSIIVSTRDKIDNFNHIFL